MINIDIMKDASEIVHYDTAKIPLAVQERLLSSYCNMRALCHWHEDIEWIHVLEGEMYYDINGKKQLLKGGDNIMVNSRKLHYGYSNHLKECKFTVLLFHPDLLKCNRYMYQQYVRPIIECTSFDYLHLTAGTEINVSVTEILNDFVQMKKRCKKNYSYETIGLIYSLWEIISHTMKDTLSSQDTEENSEIVLQRKMVSYIYQHYHEAITLKDIAAAGNVCRNKCCKLFQKYLQQAPIEFLNSYRLEISRKLLKGTSYSITQIATSCGYNYISYFSKIFLKKYGETPSEYRARCQE